MNLLRAQKVIAYITLMVAVGALSVAGVVGPVGMVVVPLAVLVSWFWEPQPAAFERQRVFWNLVLLGFIGLTSWQVLAGGAAVLGPAVDLVLVLVVAKLFQRAGSRDYLQIYALTFLMMAVATVLDDGLHFGVLLALYLVCCAAGFSVNQIVRQSEESRAPVRTLRIPARYVALLAAMSLALVTMSAAFFVILPRVGIGMGSKSELEKPTRMTGFSESIDLSDHGAIGLDRTLVMHVELDRPAGSLYWRGVSFDRFDGQRWSISPELRRRRSLPSVQPGRFELPPAAAEALPGGGRYDSARPPAAARPIVRQTIELEPMEADVLLALPEVRAVEYPGAGREPSGTGSRWPSVGQDRSGSLFHGFGTRQRVRYVVESAVEAGLPLESEYDPLAPLPPLVARYYLTTPQLSPRVHRLAAQLSQSAEGNPLAIARRIERYLSAHYDYTLDLPERGSDPIDNFLFEDRRGHCEFFSTAMVMLLRASGIPARNVNGFQGAEYNEVGRYWAVRRMNAHSWVEAWIPGIGWTTFDPTPEAGLPSQRVLDEEDPPGALAAWVEHLQRLWRGWVLSYDLRRQLDLVGALDRDGSPSLGGAMSGLWQGLKAHWWRWTLLALWLVGVGLALRSARRGAAVVSAVVVIGVVGGVVLVRLVWSQPPFVALAVSVLGPLWLAWRLRVLGPREPRAAQDEASNTPLGRLYLRVVSTLAARTPGHREAVRLPPEALAERLSGGTELERRVAAFVRRYARLRFGPGPLEPSAVRELRREARELRRALRQ